jgi:hypothetical protein
MQLFLLSHFTSQGYDVMGRSSTPLRLLRITSQTAGYVANSDTSRRRVAHVCGWVRWCCALWRLVGRIACTVPSDWPAPRPWRRSCRVCDGTPPPLKYCALFFAGVKEFWLHSCGEGIVFLSLFLMVFTVQFFVKWDIIENSIVLRKDVGQVK